MSVAGILSSLFTSSTLQSVSKNKQQFQQEFQQLGQDLQSGNLSAAQSDFTTLQKDAPQSVLNSSQSSSPIAQAFQQLSQDLQSGNTTAAQQDFANIQQSFQQIQSQAAPHHHHHGGGGQDQNTVSQLFAQLGQDLQSGNQTAALQAYTSLQNDFAPFATNSTGSPAATGVAATA